MPHKTLHLKTSTYLEKFKYFIIALPTKKISLSEEYKTHTTVIQRTSGKGNGVFSAFLFM
jgi:hypothetical protein